MTTTQVIKIEQIPGKPVLVYSLLGLKELIRLNVLGEKDIDALPMTKAARLYWQTISNTHNRRKA